MSVIEDIAVIEEQEKVLQFAAFDADTAWQLGGVLRSKLVERGAGATVEIEIAGQVLFTCATVGAKPGQADWIRRKRNTVQKFGRSTYAIGRMLERDGQTLEGLHGLDIKDYAAHGGGFPIVVVGAGRIGSVIVSGLPQRDDHALVVSALAEVLGVSVAQLE